MNETHCTPDHPCCHLYQIPNHTRWRLLLALGVIGTLTLTKRYEFKRPSCVDGFMSHWVKKICVHLRSGEHISAVCLLSAGVKLGPPYCRELFKCMDYQSGYLNISSSGQIMHSFIFCRTMPWSLRTLVI
jgi:hypothetical protein